MVRVQTLRLLLLLYLIALVVELLLNQLKVVNYQQVLHIQMLYIP